MKNVSLVALSIVCIVALAYAAAQAKQLQQANYRISQLERELRVTAVAARLGAKAQAAAEPSNSERSTLTAGTSSVPLAAEASSTSASKLSLAEWRTNQQLEEIEQYIALNNEQREAIRQTLNNAAAQAGSGSTPSDQDSLKKNRQQAVATVLGEDTAEQLERDLARQQEEALAQELDSETFALSRKLQLTAEQEEHLRTALSYTQTILQQEKSALGNKMSEAMAQHFDQDPERAQLRELYQEIKSLSTQLNTKKYTALVEQLTGVLSPDQLNALMAQQPQ